MQELLTQNNIALLHEIEQLQRSLIDAQGKIPHTFFPRIQQKLDDMITETGPRKFQESEVSNQEIQSTFTSPVALLNKAWHKFIEDPDGYREWEENAIARFLDADLGTFLT